jgi:acyl-CoA reductase-like NAD-dependent aldehyde dehydrogenase
MSEFSQATLDLKIAQAKSAALLWENMNFSERAKVLLNYGKFLVKNGDLIARNIKDETGKLEVDGLLEVLLSVNHLKWAAKNAENYLSDEKRPGGILGINTSAKVIWKPYGVVGVIGPWNYPVFTPMGSISYALAAKNAVLFKPSPFSHLVGELLAKLWRDSLKDQRLSDLFQCLPGDNLVGELLAGAAVNKISFTGSAATGKKVMAKAATNLTPVVIEAGGMDPVFIDESVNVKKAAESIFWSAMSNSGQTCIGATRIFIEAGIYDEMKSALLNLINEINPGNDYGRMVLPNAPQTIANQVSDCLARGAEVIHYQAPQAGDQYLSPIILGAQLDSKIITEEIFGPIIFLTKVNSIKEAIEFANQSKFGLGGALWARSKNNELVNQINSGMVSVNSAAAFAGNPNLPFGGVGESGFGRIHGPEGLKEFAYPVAISRELYPLPINLTKIGENDRRIWAIKKFLKLLG